MKIFTITLGIPTYEAFNSLEKTLLNVYSLPGFEKINQVLVVTDGKNIHDTVLENIKHKKLKIVNNKIRLGHSSRINQLSQLSSTDYLILINDDVILSRDSLIRVYESIEKKEFDLLSASAKPLSPSSIFERIIEVGAIINGRISKYWNNYQNYLSCNGRMVVLSKRFYKTLELPEKLLNSDAYVFLQCKINNFKYIHDEKLIVWYRSPNNLREHIRQSKKFRLSFEENTSYLGNIKEYYRLPKKAAIKASVSGFIVMPVLFIPYLLTTIRVSFTKNPLSNSGYWETDKSTKKL